MPELVTIPISYFEFSADFDQPVVALWLDRATVVQAMFAALKPWDLSVDDVEPITTGKPSEQGINFKLSKKKVSFFFGPAGCRLTWDNADWLSAEEIIKILDAAVSTLRAVAGVALSKQRALIALHIQPKKLHFVELLKPFISAQLSALEQDEVTTSAMVVKWKHRKVTIDGSGALANAIFLRFEREFDARTSYQDIAAQLKADEEQLLKLIGLEEDLG
jgi:hypothetical protein